MAAPTLGELVAPGRTALVLQEIQNGIVGPTSGLRALADAAREVGAIANSGALARAARAAGVPVVHATAESLPDRFGANRNARLFHGARAQGVGTAPGSESVAPVPEVYEPGDVVLPRYHGLSPITGTQLDSLLRNAGITNVVIVGVSLNVAIPNTVFDLVNRGYQVVLPDDAVAGVPVDYGRAVVTNTLSLLATVVATADIVTAWTT